MDNQIAMRIIHCFANLCEQPHTLPDRQIAPVAINIQMFPGNILHHQIRLPAVAQAGIQHTGDIGVVERGQNMLLAMKPLDERRPGRMRR